MKKRILAMTLALLIAVPSMTAAVSAEPVQSESAADEEAGSSARTDDAAEPVVSDADAEAPSDSLGDVTAGEGAGLSGEEPAGGENAGLSGEDSDTGTDVTLPGEESADDEETDLSRENASASESEDAQTLTEEADETLEEESASSPLNAERPTADAALEAGIYTIKSKKNEAVAWTIPSGVTSDTGLVLKDFTGKREQKFVVTPLGSGLYSIVNYESGRSLDIPDASAARKLAIRQHKRNQSKAQKFYIRQGEDGYCTVELSYADNVFDVKGGDAVSGGTLQTYRFNGTDAQYFKFERAESEPLTAGFYTIHLAADDSRSITVNGNNKANKGVVTISKNKNATGQKFTVSEVEGGFLISASCSWYALDVCGGTMADGTNIQTYNYNNTSAQKWLAIPNDDGSYKLQSVKDAGYYLTPKIRKKATYSYLTINKALPSEEAFQSFTFEKWDAKRTLPDGPFTIAAYDDSSKVIDIEGGSYEKRANARLYKSNKTNAQKFYLTYQGGGWYTIKNARSGLVLDVAGGKAVKRTNVQQYKNNGTKAQKWSFQSEGNGAYRIKSALGLMMDIAGGKALSKTNIQIYPANTRSNAQLFKLIPVKVVPDKPRYKIAIDAGHQRVQNKGKEPNGPGSSVLKQKVSSGTYGNWSHLNEYELNLQVALKLETELKARGYDVFMIRRTHDVNISNAERAQMAANAKADIFIRIHANSVDSSSVRGALAYQPSSSNPYLSAAVISGSQRLSRLIVDHQCAATGLPNRGVLTGDDMTGINWAKMPVTIIEMGFMSNPTDDLYMASASGQAAIVKGIANGVDAYFK